MYHPYPLLDSRAAAATMNYYGAQGIAFLFVIDYRMQRCRVIPLDKVNPDEIMYSIGEKTNVNNHIQVAKKLALDKYPPDFTEYLPKFRAVMRQIALGNTYLLNLTCATPIQINLSLKEIFTISSARYKLCIEGQFVCFSPETFVKMTDNQVVSCPMKGTINAALPNAKNLILNNLKEIAEHYTIVDLIRNDLSIVAKKVRVEKFRYVDTIYAHDKTLLQVSSCIVGDLPENYQTHIGDLLFRLLPAGSVSGAPKIKTVEIIDSIEGYDRGYYTGIFGIFDGKNLDSAVAIRFIEQTEAGFVFKSGGGITSHSTAELEYNEMIEKIYVPIT